MSDRTWGRSAIGTAWSSPTIDTSNSALRIPCFDEKSRYTVAGATAASSLMASTVVAPYPRSRNRRRAASTTAARAKRVRAWSGLTEGAPEVGTI